LIVLAATLSLATGRSKKRKYFQGVIQTPSFLRVNGWSGTFVEVAWQSWYSLQEVFRYNPRARLITQSRNSIASPGQTNSPDHPTGLIGFCHRTHL
jgi:hypothetical protein